MKKTLVALAVAGISTSALAAGNIYDDGTSSFNVKGEIDAYLSTLKAEDVNGNEVAKSDMDIDLWAKIQIDTTHKVNQDLSVFGSFEVENGNGFGYGADSNSVKTDDLYIGANFGDNWGVAIGEVGDFGDSLDAITLDNTNEGWGYMDDFVHSVESAGHAVSVKGNFDKLTVIGDVYLNQDDKNDTVFGLSAQYVINDMITLGASYQDQGDQDQGEAIATNRTFDYSVMGVAAGFNMDNFSAGLNYVAEEAKSGDKDTWSAVAAYQMNEARLYTSIGTMDGDNDVEGSYYTFGADYAVTGSLSTFVEYSVAEDTLAEQASDESTADEDTRVIAGVYYTF
jgi:outer membrane porin protein LC